ncbi:MAG: Hsp70 family protein [Polyangia bacterium]
MSATSSPSAPGPRYVVGIDLGTTHSVLAYLDTQALPEDEHAGVTPTPQVLLVPQVVQPGQVEARPLLPSFLYLASPNDFPAGSLDLPWAPGRDYVVGELARSHGAQVPMRLVSSAKSWLAYEGVDREAPILPYQAPAEGPDAVPKVSPVEASARYLRHLRDAWDQKMAGFPLCEQDVLITVPASFDQVARELTVRAAHAAGLSRITLLEEPQAAFYAWLGKFQKRWRELLRVGDVVLVCDVGGGTTDFSLIAVHERDGSLELERIAVGDHILLGGDNMDLALAMSLGRRLEREGHKLEAWQRRQLLYACRQAKEDLLSAEQPRESAPVVVLGRGSKVIGGSVKTQLLQADVERFLLDGFFPRVEAAARPAQSRRVGLQEIGLPFASDPAVTRHLAKFLGDHRPPTAVLFNGGVMKGGPLRQRVEDVLGAWLGSDGATSRVRSLAGADYDRAVALGAAYYGLVRRGRGLRIRGGTARAYYIGIEASLPAVPGMDPVLHALCVAPRGMEEGTSAEVPGREFGLFVGEPVDFRFLSSSTRKGDRVGDLIEEVSPEHGLEELAPVEAVLPAGDGTPAGTRVPVRLSSHVSEVGVLELWCSSRDGKRRWKLEYNIRERPTEAGSASPDAPSLSDYGEDDELEIEIAGEV